MKEKYIIGDLILHTTETGEGRVGEILRENKNSCLVKFKNSIMETIFKETLKPISLTMEILEHNGFTVGNYNEWSNPKCSFLHFVIDSLDENKWSVYARRTKDEVQLTTIKYVHELQHLLFGLDINIKIEINESL